MINTFQFKNIKETFKFIFFFALILSCNTSQEYSPQAKLLVPNKAHSFKPGEIKLLDGPFLESQNTAAKYILSLEPDRLLAPFRTESGLKTKAQAYPGWENSLPGVALSLYLSGVSRLYAITGEKEYLNRINYILGDLEKCQTKNDGYLLGIKGGKQVFAKVEKEGFYEGFSNWAEGHGEPYYVMEKLFSGLIDVYRICNIHKALKIVTNLADWLETHMSHINNTDMQKIMEVEYGGMNWVLCDLYVLTGNKKYLSLSKRWHDNEVVVPITKSIDVLTGKHANTQFPKMSGLAARYPYTADSSDLNGAIFFWESVVKHRTYVTGGNSEGEEFCVRDSMSHTLTPFTEENCNEYNMLKLTSLLFNIEPQVEYADYMERTLFNHILSAQNIEDGRVCYYLPLMSGAERHYETLYKSFSCCVCTGMDSYTRHSEYIYAHTESDLYVNLFIASELIWKKKGITIAQETKFPYEDITRFTFTCEKETEIGLLFRDPYWLAEPITIKINGEILDITPTNGYYKVQRKWNTDDIVEVYLPMNIRIESMPDDKSKIALFHGPILLAGSFEKEDANRLVESNLAPALIPGDKPIYQWLKPTSTPLKYIATVARPKEIHLEPFFTLKKGAYSVYWQKLSDNEWRQRLDEERKRKEYLNHLERITTDVVLVGNKQSELKHDLSGKSVTGNGNKGILTDQIWRVATDTAGFSYEMKIPDNVPVILFCKFMGPTNYETWDCRIKIDNNLIAELKREKDVSSPVPFELTYPIPYELTKNKNLIKVAFKVEGSHQMPRLMEMRTIIR